MSCSPSWLRQRHAALEVLFYFLIAVTTITLCAPWITVIRDKARLLEVLSLLSGARGEVVLDYAHNGYLTTPELENSGDLPVAETIKGMEYVRQQSRLVAHGPLYPARDKPSDAISADASPSPRPIVLSMRPAVPQMDPAWSMLWLCGTKAPPAGWLSPGEGAAVGLTHDQTPFVCRNTSIAQ